MIFFEGFPWLQARFWSKLLGLYAYRNRPCSQEQKVNNRGNYAVHAHDAHVFEYMASAMAAGQIQVLELIAHD